MRTVGSLFTGYGGLDLAVCQHYQAKLIWWSESDPTAATIHEQHTGTPNLGDITTIDWTTRTARTDELFPISFAPPDIISGGFPCQDLSYAGQGAGLDGDRSGLWWHMCHAVSVLRPWRVVVENVGAVRSRGLDAVTHALAEIGYVGSWTTLRASDVGACHRRERVFLVAANSHR